MSQQRGRIGETKGESSSIFVKTPDNVAAANAHARAVFAKTHEGFFSGAELDAIMADSQKVPVADAPVADGAVAEAEATDQNAYVVEDGAVNAA